jgi:hypothetical protein
MSDFRFPVSVSGFWWRVINVDHAMEPPRKRLCYGQSYWDLLPREIQEYIVSFDYAARYKRVLVELYIKTHGIGEMFPFGYTGGWPHRTQYGLWTRCCWQATHMDWGWLTLNDKTSGWYVWPHSVEYPEEGLDFFYRNCYYEPKNLNFEGVQCDLLRGLQKREVRQASRPVAL